MAIASVVGSLLGAAGFTAIGVWLLRAEGRRDDEMKSVVEAVRSTLPSAETETRITAIAQVLRALTDIRRSRSTSVTAAHAFAIVVLLLMIAAATSIAATHVPGF